ncbi:MAG TPA: hypothetical protein VN699_07055 [Pirellulales bacterium]|nr:hypothetical protein [Pirellulales bacterium]
MKKTLMSVLAFVLLLGAAVRATAQEDASTEVKPVVVVSFSGYGELKRDLEYLGTTSGNPDMAKTLEGMLALFTQGQGLAGLDQDKPWGAAASLPEGGLPNVLAFLPVSDLQKLLGALAGLTGEPVDKGDGVLEIKRDANSIFIKEQDGWAFVAQTPEALATLPADPLKILGGLEKQYDIAVRLNIQNIPQALRDFFTDTLKAQVEKSLQQAQDEDDEDGEQSKLHAQIARNQMETLAAAVNDLDQITLGWSIDGEGKRVLIDLDMTAVEDSDTAGQLAEVANSASKFAGFMVPEALLTMHMNSVAAESDIEQTMAMLGDLRTNIMESIDEDEDLPEEADKEVVKELAGEILDVAEATLKAGRINAGLAIVGEGPLTVVAGGLVADGEQLDKVAKKLVELAKSEPNLPEVQLDVEEHEGVKFHTLTLPLPDDENGEKLKELFGDELLVTLGFGPESLYVGVGDDGLETIKSVIDKSTEAASTEFPPLEITVSLVPIFKLAAQQEDSNPSVAMLAEALKEGGADHVRIKVQPIENGVQYRIEGEEGIIKLIGSAAKLATAAGGAGGF